MIDTVARFERGEDLKERTVEALQRALEAGGVEFIDENGGGRRRASKKINKATALNSCATRASGIWGSMSLAAFSASRFSRHDVKRPDNDQPKDDVVRDTLTHIGRRRTQSTEPAFPLGNQAENSVGTFAAGFLRNEPNRSLRATTIAQPERISFPKGAPACDPIARFGGL